MPTRHVFGIGLNKTGTRSLADALREMGFRVMHRGDAAASAAVRADIDAGRPPLTTIGADFDAYLDVHTIVRDFATLDRAYPGSSFILTTRDLESWLDSRERHVRANIEAAAAGGRVDAWSAVDREAWTRDRVRHHDEVRRHFAQRPDALLEYRVGVDGWEPLAAFLGCRPPATSFPRRNVAGAGTYARRSVPEVVDRTRRLTGGLVRRGRRRLGRV